MHTIKDYIRWRGDLTFSTCPVNHIDLVLLSQVPLLYLETIINANDSITLYDLLEKYYQKYKNQDIGLIIPGEVTETLYLASKQKRYKHIHLHHYTKTIDIDKEEQFCALTLNLTHSLSYIVFCPTDDTVIGWKENFNLLLNKNTYAQLDASHYLNKLYDDNLLENKKIIVGGHSKGGHLSIYASTNAHPKLQEQIINVYNFDGPGFEESFYSQENYQNISKKVIEILPVDSVIGCLFHHQEKQIVVKTNTRGLLQHNVLSWLVETTTFETINTPSRKCKHVEQKVKEIVEGLDEIGKINFINCIYRLSSVNNNQTLLSLKNNKLAIAKEYLKLTKEEKKTMLKLLNALVKDGIIRNSAIKGFIELDRYKRSLKKKNKKTGSN